MATNMNEGNRGSISQPTLCVDYTVGFWLLDITEVEALLK